jgi:hypothetical protein
LDNAYHIDFAWSEYSFGSQYGNLHYTGRSNLPDNLKPLFRSVALVIPDRKLIAQVMLFSQGIVTAKHWIVFDEDVDPGTCL